MTTDDIRVPANVSFPIIASDSGERRKTARHAYRLLLLTIILRPFGNLSLAWGMKHIEQVLGFNLFLYAGAMLHPFVALGIGLLILSLFSRMALLSVADLSFVLPLTAIGYIVTAVLGKVFLHERVSLVHWFGTGLVFLGVAVVSSTSVQTGLANQAVAAKSHQ